MRTKQLFRPAVLLLLLAIMSAAIYGFTAQNTIAGEIRAGIGSGEINGYNVTNVRYVLSHPIFTDRVTAVAFDLDEPAASVYARFAPTGGSGVWNPCLLVTPPSTWYCPGFFEDLESISSLEVASAD